MSAEAEAARAEWNARAEANRQKIDEEMQRESEAEAAKEAENRRIQHEQLEAAHSARAKAEARLLETEEEARQDAADAALNESFRRGPVNNRSVPSYLGLGSQEVPECLAASCRSWLVREQTW